MKAERAHDKQLKETWADFFEPEPGEAAPEPELQGLEEAPAPQPLHPRGVAPELGDSGLAQS
jgi:hypothetical protein